MATNKLDTFYEHYNFLYPKPWSVNLPFLCVKCGNCCSLDSFFSTGGIFSVYPSDKQISEIKLKTKPYFEKTHRIVDNNKRKEYQMKTKCPFLQSNNYCEIYSVRPSGCQFFPKTDFGMNTEKGFCESLDRFKRFREVLLKEQEFIGYDFFTFSDGIQPVKMTNYQYEKCVTTLIKAGMTTEELKLFKKVNYLRM